MQDNYLFYYLSSSSNPDDIRYIGVTCKTLEQRFSGHKYCATHANKRIQPVHKWMYHEMSLGHTISINWIEDYFGDWESEEIRLIQKYRDLGFNLLNVSKGGCGIITSEMRTKNGIQRSAEAHMKKIVAVDPKTMTLYKEFDSLKDAFKHFGEKGKRTSISNVLNNRARTSHGYYWLFKDDYDKYGVSQIDTSIHFMPNQKVFYQFDIYKNLIKEHNSKKKLVKTTGFSEGGLSNALKNLTLYHDCFWTYDKDFSNYEEAYQKAFPYKEINNSNEIINEFKTLNELSDYLKLSPSKICSELKNKGEIKRNNSKIIKIKI